MTWGPLKRCSRGLGEAGLPESVGNRTRKLSLLQGKGCEGWERKGEESSCPRQTQQPTKCAQEKVPRADPSKLLFQGPTKSSV